MRFGAGTMVNGPVTSNIGIHFDGIANNVISSAMATYTDPDYASGLSCTNVSYGVHTCVSPADPSPPSAAANNTAVFAAGRQYPVPATDFNGLEVNLQRISITALFQMEYAITPTLHLAGLLPERRVIILFFKSVMAVRHMICTQ